MDITTRKIIAQSRNKLSGSARAKKDRAELKSWQEIAHPFAFQKFTRKPCESASVELAVKEPDDKGYLRMCLMVGLTVKVDGESKVLDHDLYLVLDPKSGELMVESIESM